MYAMLLARFKMFPEVKEKGMSSVPRLAAFTSEHVGIHASIDDLLCHCVSSWIEFARLALPALDVCFLRETLCYFHTIIADIKLTLCMSDAEGHKMTGVSVTLHVTSSVFKGHLKDAERKKNIK